MESIKKENLGQTIISSIKSGKLVVKKEQLVNTKFERCWDTNLEIFVKNMEKYWKTGNISKSKALLKILEIEKEFFLDLEVVEVKEYYIIGCYTGKNDIDVMCVVENLESLYSTKEIEKEIRLEGKAQEFDFNFVTIKNGILNSVKKGSLAITNNIAYNTYKYHEQKHKLRIEREVEIDIHKAFDGVMSFLLNHLDKLMSKSKYAKYREEKRRAYVKGGIVRQKISLCFLILLEYTEFDNEKSQFNWLSAIKSLTLKMCQAIQFYRGVNIYTKPELAKTMTNLNTEHLEALMARKTNITNFETFIYLAYEFIDIYNKVNYPLEWSSLKLDTSLNTTPHSDIEFTEFLKSPMTPTPKFLESYGSEKTKAQILIPKMGTCPESIKHLVETCEQRSPEWFELLKFYKTNASGKYAESKEEKTNIDYHFVRGNILESLVLNTDFTSIFGEHEKIVVGMLTASKGVKSSLCCSPDLLISNAQGIFPCEIKVVPGKFLISNTSYRRAVSLATKQLTTASNILGSNFGYLIFVYVDILDKNKNYFTIYTARVEIM